MRILLYLGILQCQSPIRLGVLGCEGPIHSTKKTDPTTFTVRMIFQISIVHTIVHHRIGLHFAISSRKMERTLIRMYALEIRLCSTLIIREEPKVPQTSDAYANFPVPLSS